MKFEAKFATPPPGLKSKEPYWFFSADYINHRWTDAYGCQRFDVSTSAGKSNPTVAWFYNQETKDVTAKVGLYCTFNNGQTLSLARRGKLNVFAPSTTFTPTPSGTLKVGVYLIGIAPALGLANVENIPPGIGLPCRIVSKTGFNGEAKVTQLITSNHHINGGFVPWPAATCGATLLDNVDPYPSTVVRVGQDDKDEAPFGLVDFQDSPSIPLLWAATADCSYQFKTYFRFKPGGDPDNIYVTLGRVDWGFHGSVAYQFWPFIPWYLPAWQVSESGTYGPYNRSVNEFPVWTLTVLNPL